MLDFWAVALSFCNCCMFIRWNILFFRFIFCGTAALSLEDLTRCFLSLKHCFPYCALLNNLLYSHFHCIVLSFLATGATGIGSKLLSQYLWINHVTFLCVPRTLHFPKCWKKIGEFGKKTVLRQNAWHTNFCQIQQKKMIHQKLRLKVHIMRIWYKCALTGPNV